MAIVINGSTGITDADGGQVLSTSDYTDISRTVDPDNRIINGNFGVWERGDIFTTNTYGADRWVNGFLGGTVTQSRQTFPLGDMLGVNTPTFFLRQTVSGQSLATDNALTNHRIEGVRSYAGQTITVLGWARRSSGSGNMAINSSQNFGTGGTTTPSDRVATAGQIVSLIGTWAPFAVTINVPSITGKILSTLGNDYLDINFWTSAGSNLASSTGALGPQTIGVDLWGIHIKLGTHAASTTNQYRPRDPGEELALCQRYYEKGSSTLLASYASGSFGGGISHVFYNTAKRRVPNVTATRTGGAGGTGTFAVGVSTISSVSIWFSGAAAAGDYMTYAYYVDAEF